MAYDPSADYASSYDALSRRIASNFAAQRGGLNQELATRGVNTSGVSAIPSASLRVGQANAQDEAAGQFALEQARTSVLDRQRSEDFQRQLQLANLGYNNENALARRMSNSGLQGALISGGLGAVGSIAAGAIRPSSGARPTYGSIGTQAGDAGGYYGNIG